MPKYHSTEFYQKMFAQARAENRKQGIVISEDFEPCQTTGGTEYTLEEVRVLFCGVTPGKDVDADK